MKEDNKNKVINQCLYLKIIYSRVGNYYDTLAILNMKRDGSAWISRGKGTYTIPSNQQEKTITHLFNLINAHNKI